MMTQVKTTLDQLDPGQSGKVIKIKGNGPVRRRLMDMGITNGVEITVVKASPLGDPVEYQVRGYRLSLRRSEAQLIEISY